MSTFPSRRLWRRFIPIFLALSLALMGALGSPPKAAAADPVPRYGLPLLAADNTPRLSTTPSVVVIGTPEGFWGRLLPVPASGVVAYDDTGFMSSQSRTAPVAADGTFWLDLSPTVEGPHSVQVYGNPGGMNASFDYFAASSVTIASPAEGALLKQGDPVTVSGKLAPARLGIEVTVYARHPGDHKVVASARATTLADGSFSAQLPPEALTMGATEIHVGSNPVDAAGATVHVDIAGAHGWIDRLVPGDWPRTRHFVPGLPVDLTGGMSPACASCRVMIDQIVDGMYYGGQPASALTDSTGHWSIGTYVGNDSLAPQSARVAVRWPDGSFWRSEWVDVTRGNDLSIAPVSGATLGEPIVVAGQLAVSNGRSESIVIDAIDGDGRYLGAVATVTSNADGAYSAIITDPRLVSGKVQLRAAVNRVGWGRSDWVSIVRQFQVIVDPGPTRGVLSNSPLPVQGRVVPAVAGVTVTFDAQNTHGYQGGVGHAVTAPDGTFHGDITFDATGATDIYVRGAVPMPGGWVRGDFAPTFLGGPLGFDPVPASAPSVGAFLVSGPCGVSGQNVIVDAIKDGAYVGQVATGSCSDRGFWAAWPRLTQGNWQLRVAAYNFGRWVRTDYVSTSFRYDAQLDAVPAQSTDSTVHYVGHASPSLEGSTVILDGFGPNGLYAGGFATATVSGDGSFHVDSAWGAGLNGPFTVRAAIKPKDADWVRGPSQSFTRSPLALHMDAPKAAAGQPVNLSGSLSPARAGATVIVDARLNGSYYSGVATATVDAAGNWRATVPATYNPTGTVEVRPAVFDGSWTRLDFVTVARA